MSKQTMNTYTRYNGHEYRVLEMGTGHVYTNEKLPPLLKKLREDTGYTFKIPHGNKVRTLILEEGVCHIYNGDILMYEITIDRW